MSEARQIALVNPTQQSMPASYFPSDSDWKMMLDVGTKAVRSGMLPSGIKTPEAAAIIALKAKELNMPIMVGFAHIHVINGKPTLSAEMMQSLARKNLPGLVINIIESSSERATVEFIRPEAGSKPYKITFTLEDAKRADLMKNPTWQKYPAAMLWSRAVSAGLRKVCPEALIGVSYTPEELGANVDQDGNVIETTSRQVEESAKPEALKVPAVESEIDLKIKAEFQKIALLKNELQLSNDDLKAEVHKEFGTDDARKLTLEQLKQVTAMLEKEQEARKQGKEVNETEDDAPWLKEV